MYALKVSLSIRTGQNVGSLDAGSYSIYKRIIDGSPSNLNGLNDPERDRLFHVVYNNKVASLRSLPRYDPTCEIGFCFGRAMAARLIARKMGLKEEGIGNIFIVGDLKSNDVTEWRFHTAAIVNGNDGTKYVIDPILPEPVSIKRWINIVRKRWDRDVQAKVYLTPASVVMPDVRIFPEREKEKGEHLIENSFNPANKPGFTKNSSLGDLVFNVTPSAAKRYFLDAEEEGTERFDFTGITINGKRYNYNNYFRDLLTDLAKDVQLKRADTVPKNRGAYIRGDRTFMHKTSLLSPRWGVK